MPRRVFDTASGAAKSIQDGDSDPNITIKGADFTDKETKKLATRLHGALFLRKFVLSNCIINSSQLDMLLKSLFDVPLIELRLPLNKLDDKSAISISSLLKKCKTIKTLVLSTNQIGDGGAIQLADAMITSPLLETVLFADNQIGDAGARALLNAIESNKSIKELYLAGNRISKALMDGIADAVLKNDPTALKRFSETHIGPRAGIFGASDGNVSYTSGSGSAHDGAHTAVIPPRLPVTLTQLEVRGMIEYLELSEGYKSPDLAGSVSRSECQRVLVDVFRARDVGSLSKLLQNVAAANISGAIRLHLKKQPTPLIRYSAYPIIVADAKAIGDDIKFADRIAAALMSNMTFDEVDFLGVLMGLLRKVTSVRAEDIAFTWGPIVLRGPTETIEDVAEPRIAERVIEVCLRHHMRIFFPEENAAKVKKLSKMGSGLLAEAMGGDVQQPQPQQQPQPPQQPTPGLMMRQFTGGNINTNIPQEFASPTKSPPPGAMFRQMTGLYDVSPSASFNSGNNGAANSGGMMMRQMSSMYDGASLPPRSPANGASSTGAIAAMMRQTTGLHDGGEMLQRQLTGMHDVQSVTSGGGDGSNGSMNARRFSVNSGGTSGNSEKTFKSLDSKSLSQELHTMSSATAAAASPRNQPLPGTSTPPRAVSALRSAQQLKTVQTNNLAEFLAPVNATTVKVDDFQEGGEGGMINVPLAQMHLTSFAQRSRKASSGGDLSKPPSMNEVFSKALDETGR